MEHEMKISTALVRRLRTEHGWSQDQLATAAGLSLRTIQRVEAEGTASMATRVCLAATFGVPLAQLGDETAATPAPAPRHGHFSRLLCGLAVLSCALLSESLARVQGGPLGQGMFAVNLLFAAAGAWLVAPAAWQLLRRQCAASIVLAGIGMPFAMLLLGGLVMAALRAHPPSWSLLALGTCGIALVAMAWRNCAQALRG